MICPYCDREVNTKFCPHCGAAQKLPEQPAQATPAQTPPAQPAQVFAPVHVHMGYESGLVCRHCGSRGINTRPRGFRWGLAILGFIFLPPFGLLFGFIGSKKPVIRCSRCGKKY